MPDLLTTAQVAEELGLTPIRIRQLATSRNVGTLYGRQLMFTPAEVDAMRKRTTGRPRKIAP